MPRIVMLDSGPLGLLAYTRSSTLADDCNRWLSDHLAIGTVIVVPEIADYEVRRELLRLDLIKALLRLETLLTLPGISYLPISTAAMRLAAELWAQVRRSGQPTADPKALDADVILAAQALLLAEDGDRLVVATSNPSHIARFVPAAEWQDIPPD